MKFILIWVCFSSSNPTEALFFGINAEGLPCNSLLIPLLAIAALNTGYDLRTLVNEDIKSRKNEYEIETIDIDIDFRRTKNLKIYLDNNALVLTNDLSKIEEWQGGDIVVFKGHIGVVSDKRNENGIPYLIHHANAFQTIYEEPGGLERLNDIIIGHYRLS